MYAYGVSTTLTGTMFLQLVFRIRQLIDPTVFFVLQTGSAYKSCPWKLADVWDKQKENGNNFVALYKAHTEKMENGYAPLFADHQAACRENQEHLSAESAKRVNVTLQRLEKYMEKQKKRGNLLRSFVLHEMVKSRWQGFYAEMFPHLLSKAGHTYDVVKLASNKGSTSKIPLVIDTALYKSIDTRHPDDVPGYLELQNEEKLDEKQKQQLCKYMHMCDIDMLPCDIFPAAREEENTASLFYLMHGPHGSKHGPQEQFSHVLMEHQEDAKLFQRQLECCPCPMMQDSSMAHKHAIKKLCTILGLQHSLDINTVIQRDILQSNACALNEACADAEVACGELDPAMRRALRLKRQTQNSVHVLNGEQTKEAASQKIDVPKLQNRINSALKRWAAVNVQKVDKKSHKAAAAYVVQITKGTVADFLVNACATESTV